jgi:PPOX class probable F420-dependent enzyme
MSPSTGSGHGFDPGEPPAGALEFLSQRHLATLTTLRKDGTPHVVPVGFTYDPQSRIARVITSGDSVKAGNANRPGAVAAICQVDGARWLTLSGPIHLDRDPAAIADAVARYARRYKRPRVNPKRVALIIEVDRMLGSGRFG